MAVEQVENAGTGSRRAVPARDLNAFEYYEPLQHRDLALEFLHVFGRRKPPAARQVIGYYERWGPLCVAVRQQQGHGGMRPFPAWALQLSEEARHRLGEDARFLRCEPMWFVRQKAAELQLSYELYAALRQDTVSGLRAMLGTVPQAMRVTGMRIERGALRRYGMTTEDWESRVGSASEVELPWEEPEGHPHRALSREECRHWAAQLLVQQLNQGEDRSSRRWSLYQPVPTDSPRTRPLGRRGAAALGVVWGQHFDDLLAGMQLQLGLIVARHAVLKRCPGCDRLFFQGRSDQSYCTKHCGDAARQRLVYRPNAPRPCLGKKARRKVKRSRAR